MLVLLEVIQFEGLYQEDSVLVTFMKKSQLTMEIVGVE